MGWSFFLRHQTFGDEKAIRGYAQRRVVMKAAPAASLEVPQAEFLLELLIIALNAPAQFCNSHEFLDRRVSRQRAEEVSGRFELFLGPLHKQPLLFAGLVCPCCAGSTVHPYGRNARRQEVVGTV